MKNKTSDTAVPIATLGNDEAILAGLIEDVRNGLGSTPKSLPSKYLYDARGSELFEDITRQPDYYPTQAEIALLEKYAPEVVRAAQPEEIMEIGAGASRKNQLLLEAFHEIGGTVYAPIDVSGDALEITAKELEACFPWLEFRGHVADFGTDMLRVPRHGRRLVCFLGSTIGNLEEPARIEFLRTIRAMLEDDETFLMGVDLVKPIERLERAYNDSGGVTALFTRNIVNVLNRAFEGDMPYENFEHLAFYNRDEERVEIYLVAKEACTVRLPMAQLEVQFEAGERVRTEVSCKFHRARVERELGLAGLRVERWIEDSAGDFGMVVARPG